MGVCIKSENHAAKLAGSSRAVYRQKKRFFKGDFDL
jgi:hypothetical protein